PSTIGWVGMGFRIDRQLLQDMNNLSGMEVALLLRENTGDWRVSVATMDLSKWSEIANAWERPINNDDTQGVAMRVGGIEY
ncbi:hypothetical protein, partial [Vibrio vulnificus]|uniref:hypothetical protein n=1 Tax=Vibrio vulnificus TaxID=672 RepID=UPI00188A6EEB